MNRHVTKGNFWYISGESKSVHAVGGCPHTLEVKFLPGLGNLESSFTYMIPYPTASGTHQYTPEGGLCLGILVTSAGLWTYGH